MPESIEDFYWFGLSNKINITQSYSSIYKLDATPLISGKRATLSQALERLNKVIRKGEPIHFDGMTCDQHSLFSIFDLAEFSRSSINHQDGIEINSFYKALSIHGGSLTSFNELKKRSDLIFFVGYFNQEVIKSFYNSLEWNKNKFNASSYFFCNPKKREGDQYSIDFLKNFCEFFDLIINDKTNSKFPDLKNKFSISKYPVFVLNPKNGCTEMNEIFKLSEKLNKLGKKVRLFKLSGENNSSGFVNACITKTGYPCSVNFSDWGAYYDPEYYNASAQSKLKSTQLLFSNLTYTTNFTKFKKNIYIGHPNCSVRKLFDIYIPVKTPGVDADGLVVRSDGNAMLKLEKKIESNYPKIYEIINSIVRHG